MVSSNSSDKGLPNCTIGSRVSSNGGHGTVLYIGEVAPHEGLWFGVDWDDSSRGKHDGCYRDVRYFHASSPTSGSFVRPNKVQYGCPFMEAVREKYTPATSDQFDVIHVSGTKTIEFVGMEEIATKQSQLHRLREVILDNFLIDRADDDLGTIAISFPNVMELHMCNTLISDWNEVVKICLQLPKLNYLNLSLNVFKPLDPGKIYQSIPGIRSLILTECRLNWGQVNSLSALFPNLTELGLCRNQITAIDSVGFRNLRSLDLESNSGICAYSDISIFASLPCLETLNLSNTGWGDFELPSKIPSPDGSIVPFPALKTFYLFNDALKNWRSVNELDKVPSLEQLLIHGNPIMTRESSGTARQFCIAKIKNLKILDRQVITAQERRGAEIDYLKIFGRNRSQVDQQEFAKEHPRYEELCKIYGAPEEWEMRVTQKGVLKNGILDLNIEVAGKQPVVKKIPGSMTVQKLKALIGRLYSIDVRRMQLAYESPLRPGVIVPLENDLRDLVFYSLESGNRVLVNNTA